jgi:uncharacterized protein
MFMITSVYAAILGLLFIYLSVRTLRARRLTKISIGDGANPELLRKIRVHANFQEYAPMGIILAGLLESHSPAYFIVHLVCICLLFGRFLHAYGVSQSRENFKFRVSGMALTFTSIGTSALGILFMAVT